MAAARAPDAQRPGDHVGDGHRPVVAETLADRTRFLGGEDKVLREVDGVAVFVQDHLGVLGIVHAALAEAQLVLGVVGGERVVLPELIDPYRLRPVVDRPLRSPEAEAVDVLLRLGDPVVGHDLLELVLVPRVEECVGR